MKLACADYTHFTNLQKGYEGELKFDVWSKDLLGEWVVLNDLLLEYNHSYFQIDSLYYSKEKLRLFDIKNFEGDFYIKDDKWLSNNGKEIKNPLHQLYRCEVLLKRLLFELGVNIPIESHLIFVNPEFYLYNADATLPIIYPAQLNRFRNKLNTLYPYSKIKQQSYPKFMNQLKFLHIEKSPFTQLPSYSYEYMRKGITCISCLSFVFEVFGEILVCKQCGVKETLVHAVLRSVEEYVFLFPERKITTNDIFDWCGIIKSKKTIRRILGSGYIHHKKAKSSFFIEKK
jgi:hypothetical protein